MEVPYNELSHLVGRNLGPTEWMVVDQARINCFADATDDHQWIHVDIEAAKNGPFGQTIAHGYLTLALVNKFLPDLVTVTRSSMGVNYGCERVRFPAPLPVNTRIRGTGEVLAVQQVSGGQQLVVRVTVQIEDGERPACVADTISRFFP